VLTTEEVRWWSDFNRVFYHPRSAIQINQYQLDTSAFESFSQGIELFRDIDKACFLIWRGVNCRAMIFSTEMSDHLLKRVIHCMDSKYLWKVTLHGLDLGQSISRQYVASILNLPYGRGELNQIK